MESIGIGSVGSGPVSLRRSADRDRLSRAMGLARSFQRDEAGARRCLRDLHWKLAQALSSDQGPDKNHTLSGRGHRDSKELLRAMRNAAYL
jgi:hypothetical protein